MTHTHQTTQFPGKPRCFNCNGVVDAATPLDPDRAPKSGDVMICLYCSAVAIFEPPNTFRRLTPDERREIEAVPQFREALAVAREFRARGGAKDRTGLQ